MATFIHIADERAARRILCGGIRAKVFATPDEHTEAPRRGVFCVPVVPNFQSTFQWLRELKRRGYNRACGIQFRIDDAESVFCRTLQSVATEQRHNPSHSSFGVMIRAGFRS
jgi:hypothetical protein